MNVIGPHEDGVRAATPGYDHSWFPWSPLPGRPRLEWPGGARVAVSVVLDLGAVEWEADGPGPVPPPGGRGVGPHPDFPRMSHREYGHRVGVFRLLDILGRLGIPVAAAVDVLTVEHYGPLLAHLRGSVTEFVAAGLSASRPITSRMSEDEERHYIASTLDRLEARLGVRPQGWLGPERSESQRTPALLAEAGVGYVADWCNDDQPYAMPGAGGDLWTYPLSWELADVNAMFLHDTSAAVYGGSLEEAVEVLSGEGATAGRALGIHLHPWVSGQPFRAGAVESALERIRGDSRVWWAPPGEVVAWSRRSA
jgi:hypothetical protein